MGAELNPLTTDTLSKTVVYTPLLVGACNIDEWLRANQTQSLKLKAQTSYQFEFGWHWIQKATRVRNYEAWSRSCVLHLTTLNQTSPISCVTDTPPFFNDLRGKIFHIVIFTTFDVKILQRPERGPCLRIVKPNYTQNMSKILHLRISYRGTYSLERRMECQPIERFFPSWFWEPPFMILSPSRILETATAWRIAFIISRL